MLLWMEVRSLRGLFLPFAAYTDGERMGWYEMEIGKEGYGGAAGRQAYYLPAAWCGGMQKCGKPKLAYRTFVIYSIAEVGVGCKGRDCICICYLISVA